MWNERECSQQAPKFILRAEGKKEPEGVLFQIPLSDSSFSVGADRDQVIKLQNKWIKDQTDKRQDRLRNHIDRCK